MNWRPIVLLLASAGTVSAWTQSVEFPWNICPRPLWERQLVWIKNAGFTHVSLPPAKDTAPLMDAIRIVRRLGLEADLEGPVPPSLQSLMKSHGGPLTDTASETSVRVSALAPDALLRSRKVLIAGKQSLIWTDVQDTLGPNGFHAGAVNFSEEEGPGADAVRRSAQLGRYWGSQFGSLRAIPGAGPKLPVEYVTAQQFAGENGISLVSAVNNSARPWTGDLKVLYPALIKILVLPGLMLPPHDSLWFPVDIPLTGAFGKGDHLVYATAEMTSMEYENGILAMDFSAPAGGEAVLQISRQPTGPLVAGGKLAEFEWDDRTQRVRLTIPKGSGPGSHVRIGLAIDAPDATAFLDNARVLLIGETNKLTAEFSSGIIAGRSRLRVTPEMPVTQEPDKDDLKAIFTIPVPASAVEGDHAELAIEADGIQMSHSRPQFRPSASIHFADETTVRLGASSSLPLFPPVVAVNERSGREITLTIHNNAPEIRTFELVLKADGLDFSPVRTSLAVGATSTRDVTFRVFPTAASGLHAGEARLSGAASATQPVQFVVLPPSGSITYTSGGLTFIENNKQRASFLPGRWLEFINKDSGQNGLPAGGLPFTRTPLENLRLTDLEAILPRPRK